MPRKRTELQKMLGKLVSQVQKEWGEDVGLRESEISEDVMYRAHDLLGAGTPEDIRKLIEPLTMIQYLGEVWVQGHPKVKAKVREIEHYLEEL